MSLSSPGPITAAMHLLAGFKRIFWLYFLLCALFAWGVLSLLGHTSPPEAVVWQQWQSAAGSTEAFWRTVCLTAQAGHASWAHRVFDALLILSSVLLLRISQQWVSHRRVHRSDLRIFLNYRVLFALACLGFLCYGIVQGLTAFWFYVLMAWLPFSSLLFFLWLVLFGVLWVASLGLCAFLLLGRLQGHSVRQSMQGWWQQKYTLLRVGGVFAVLMLGSLFTLGIALIWFLPWLFLSVCTTYASQ